MRAKISAANFQIVDGSQMNFVKMKSIPKSLVGYLRGDGIHFLSYYIFWIFVASASRLFDDNWMPNEYDFIDQMKQQMKTIYYFLWVVLGLVFFIKFLRGRRMESGACKGHVVFGVLKTMLDEITKLPFVAGALLLAVASVGFFNNIALGVSNFIGLSKYSYGFMVELDNFKNGVVLIMIGVLSRWANCFANQSDGERKRFGLTKNEVAVSGNLKAASLSVENKKSFFYSLGNPVVDLRLFNDFFKEYDNARNHRGDRWDAAVVGS